MTHTTTYTHRGITFAVTITFAHRDGRRFGDEPVTTIEDVHLHTMTITTDAGPDIVLERDKFSPVGLAIVETMLETAMRFDDDYRESLPALATPDDDGGAQREERVA